MTREDIMATIHDLAKSQGFYQRVEEGLLEMKEKGDIGYEAFMDTLEKKNFKDAVDLVMYLEG